MLGLSRMICLTMVTLQLIEGMGEHVYVAETSNMTRGECRHVSRMTDKSTIRGVVTDKERSENILT